MTKREDIGKCIDLGDGNFLCNTNNNDNIEEVESKVPEASLADEIVKALAIAFSPVMSKEEASFIESTFVAIILGTILSGIGVALGFYIYQMISMVSIPIFNGDPLVTALFMISILTILIVIISFIQYRATKALTETQILERIAIGEIIG